MIVITLIAVAVFSAFFSKTREMALSALAYIITLPVKINRLAAHRFTQKYQNKILGAVAVAENATHPLDGKNVTGQCIAFYENYVFPCVDDMMRWLGPTPPRGLTIIHLRNNNILISVIDLTDKCLLTLIDGEYCFEPLAFESLDVDDLGGLTVYNCSSLTSAMKEYVAHLEDENSSENKEE